MSPPARDGLQASRTALSWRRTAAAAGVVTGIAMHQVLTRGAPTADDVVTLLATATAALVLVLAAVVRTRALGTTTTPAPSLVLVCAGALVLATVGALIGLVAAVAS